MAWHNIPYSYWQYNDTPTEPITGNIGQHYLWSLQTDGIRTISGAGILTTQVYTQCRLQALSGMGDDFTQGELSKTHWDAVAIALSGTPFP